MLVSINTLRKRLLPCSTAIFLFGALVYPRESRGVTINATLTDLPDTTTGQNLWSASYTLSNGAFLANQGFTIFFDSALYSDLSTPLLPIPTGWDVLTIQPDLILAAPGFLDGLALVNNPSLTQPFLVNFVWHSITSPGAQPFELYDQSSTFQVIGTGQTIASVVGGGTVPDSGTSLWLLALSLPIIVFTHRTIARGTTTL